MRNEPILYNLEIPKNNFRKFETNPFYWRTLRVTQDFARTYANHKFALRAIVRIALHFVRALRHFAKLSVSGRDPDLRLIME